MRESTDGAPPRSRVMSDIDARCRPGKGEHRVTAGGVAVAVYD